MIVIYTVPYYDSASMYVYVHTSPMSTHTRRQNQHMKAYMHMLTNQRRDISFETSCYRMIDAKYAHIYSSQEWSIPLCIVQSGIVPQFLWNPEDCGLR